MDWISIEERLPADDVDVLAFVVAKGGTYMRGEKYCAVDKLCVFTDGSPKSFRTNLFGYGTVTHWMPLPEPPTSSKDIS